MSTAEIQSPVAPAAANSVLEAPSAQTRSWRLPAIDGLRAMACMMVFVIHTWEFSHEPAVILWFPAIPLFHLPAWSFDLANIVRSFPAGVDLFMVLSGFCLFWPLCKSESALQNWSCKEYVWRRIKRICPPYYVAIAYVILLPQFLVVMMRLAHVPFDGHAARFQPNPTAGDILAHMLFVHTAFYEYWDQITGAFWSLGLEGQFYIVFPLVVMQFRRHRIKAIIGMIVASIAFRLIMHFIFVYHYDINAAALVPLHRDPIGELQDVKRLCNISFLGRWMQFAFGMLAALTVSHYVRLHKLAPAWLGTLLITGALVVYLLTLLFSVDSLSRDILMGILFSCVVFAVTSTRTVIRHLFELRPIVFIGTISYSIFLIHQPTAWFFSQLITRKLYNHDVPATGSISHWLLMGTVGLAVVLLVAYPFFLLFEKPFISKPGKKKPAPKPQPAIQPTLEPALEPAAVPAPAVNP